MILIGVTNTVLTDPLHEPAVLAPVEWRRVERVVGRVVDAAGSAGTGHRVVHVGEVPGHCLSSRGPVPAPWSRGRDRSACQNALGASGTGVLGVTGVGAGLGVAPGVGAALGAALGVGEPATGAGPTAGLICLTSVCS